MTVVFSKPMNLNSDFDIPPDLTIWNPPAYTQTVDGVTAARPRATFHTIAKGLVPKTAAGTQLNLMRGLYVLLSCSPYPVIYVGIASGQAVLERLARHRVKLTGSHVGPAPIRTGGVHHPVNWQKYAMDRYTAMGPGDMLDDFKYMVWSYNSSLNPNYILANIEKQIICELYQRKGEIFKTFQNQCDGYPNFKPHILNSQLKTHYDFNIEIKVE